MIAETSQREDFSAIDKAQSIKLYIETFDVTQAEAAQRYGLKSQSAVSNLLRLLDLPAPIQEQVAGGQLPERFARSLVTVASIDPQAAVETASVIVASDDDRERQDTLEDNGWRQCDPGECEGGATASQAPSRSPGGAKAVKKAAKT